MSPFAGQWRRLSHESTVSMLCGRVVASFAVLQPLMPGDVSTFAGVAVGYLAHRLVRRATAQGECLISGAALEHFPVQAGIKP